MCSLSYVHVFRIEYVSYRQGPYRIRIVSAADRIVPALHNTHVSTLSSQVGGHKTHLSVHSLPKVGLHNTSVSTQSFFKRKSHKKSASTQSSMKAVTEHICHKVKHKLQHSPHQSSLSSRDNLGHTCQFTDIILLYDDTK